MTYQKPPNPPRGFTQGDYTLFLVAILIWAYLLFASTVDAQNLNEYGEIVAQDIMPGTAISQYCYDWNASLAAPQACDGCSALATLTDPTGNTVFTSRSMSDEGGGRFTIPTQGLSIEYLDNPYSFLVVCSKDGIEGQVSGTVIFTETETQSAAGTGTTGIFDFLFTSDEGIFDRIKRLFDPDNVKDAAGDYVATGNVFLDVIAWIGSILNTFLTVVLPKLASLIGFILDFIADPVKAFNERVLPYLYILFTAFISANITVIMGFEVFVLIGGLLSMKKVRGSGEKLAELLSYTIEWNVKALTALVWLFNLSLAAVAILYRMLKEFVITIKELVVMGGQASPL